MTDFGDTCSGSFFEFMYSKYSRNYLLLNSPMKITLKVKIFQMTCFIDRHYDVITEFMDNLMTSVSY